MVMMMIYLLVVAEAERSGGNETWIWMETGV